MNQGTQSNGSARKETQEENLNVSLNADNVDQQIEQVEEESQPNEVEKIRAEYEAKLEAARKEAETERLEKRKLGAMLTKEQQVRAEFERFHTTVLPQINKTFEERFAANPHEAVRTEVAQVTKPIADNSARTNAELWMTQVMVRDPSMAKYENRVVELSMESPEFAQMTYSKSGIEKLFRFAKMEDVEKERDELKTKIGNTQEKSRAFSEGSSPRSTPNAGRSTTAQLTPAQREVAKRLGISPENYLKGSGQVKRVGEMDDNG